MRVFITIAAIAIVIRGTIGVAGAAPPIRVTATHGSGAIMSLEGDIDSFKIIIAPDGKASISTVTEMHRRKEHATRTVKLTSAQLDSLVRAITQNRFFDLPPDMQGSAEDSPTYILDITIGDQHRHVRVYAPADYRDKSVLRRFRRVWAAISRAVGFTRDSDALHHLTVNS